LSFKKFNRLKTPRLEQIEEDPADNFESARKNKFTPKNKFHQNFNNNDS